MVRYDQNVAGKVNIEAISIALADLFVKKKFKSHGEVRKYSRYIHLGDPAK